MKLLSSALLAITLVIGTAVAEQAKEEPVWIDVRSWAENKIDSIEGDPHIPYQSILEGVSESFPQKNTPIRLYCEKGGRAGTALTALREAGYTDIENAGGIDDVRAIRFPSAQDTEQ